jgi:DNA polymerase III subunit epsilon
MNGGTAASAYRAAEPPGPRTPWREASYAVLDMELTGLDPSLHEIISFAVVPVEDGKVLPGDTVYRLVRPREMPKEDTIRIHGLRESDLEKAPPLDRVLDHLLRSLAGRVLVAHVATVEIAFLRPVLQAEGLSLRNPVVDTAALAQELHRLRAEESIEFLPEGLDEDSSPGLNALARSLGLPSHRPHHADGDALTTAQVFLALATHLAAFDDPLTLGSLLRLSRGRGGYSKAGPIRRLVQRLRSGA